MGHSTLKIKEKFSFLKVTSLKCDISISKFRNMNLLLKNRKITVSKNSNKKAGENKQKKPLTVTQISHN